MRHMVFTAAKTNLTLILKHVNGVDNGVADALSIANEKFRRFAPLGDSDPIATRRYFIHCGWPSGLKTPLKMGSA